MCIKMASWTVADCKRVTVEGDNGPSVYKLPDTVRQRFEERLESALNRSIEAHVPRFDFAAFKSVLQTVGGILAGGSVLRACYDNIPWDIDTTQKSDVDIYVNVRHVPTMKKALAAVLSPAAAGSGFEVRKSNLYCNSFLVRNRIREVLTVPGKNIDIVSVRNARNVMDVVRNFDLTMCQVWYDGYNIYATHPAHIHGMRGVLQGDYIPLYKANNRFLHARINKYRSRGFTIEIGDNMIQRWIAGIIAFGVWIIEVVFGKSQKPTAMRKRGPLYPIFQEMSANLQDDMSGYDSEDYNTMEELHIMYDKSRHFHRFNEYIMNALDKTYHKSTGSSQNKKKYVEKFRMLADTVKQDTMNVKEVSQVLHDKIEFIKKTREYIAANAPKYTDMEKTLANIDRDVEEKTEILIQLNGGEATK